MALTPRTSQPTPFTVAPKRTVNASVASRRKEKKGGNVITPELAAAIEQARRDYARGETIHCETAEEMQAFFDSL